MAERLEIIAKEELIELAREAASRLGDMTLSAYVRLAVMNQLRRDGFTVPGDAGKAEPAHRPRKDKAK